MSESLTGAFLDTVVVNDGDETTIGHTTGDIAINTTASVVEFSSVVKSGRENFRAAGVVDPDGQLATGDHDAFRVKAYNSPDDKYPIQVYEIKDVMVTLNDVTFPIDDVATANLTVFGCGDQRLIEPTLPWHARVKKTLQEMIPCL